MACGCGKCRPLRPRIAVHYTAAQSAKSAVGPVSLGLYSQEGDEAHDRLYLFHCRSCYQPRQSFPCLTTGERKILHLHCEACKGAPYLVSDVAVYRELGLPEPTVWQQFFDEIRALTKKDIICPRDGGWHS